MNDQHVTIVRADQLLEGDRIISTHPNVNSKERAEQVMTQMNWCPAIVRSMGPNQKIRVIDIELETVTGYTHWSQQLYTDQLIATLHEGGDESWS